MVLIHRQRKITVGFNDLIFYHNASEGRANERKGPSLLTSQLIPMVTSMEMLLLTSRSRTTLIITIMMRNTGGWWLHSIVIVTNLKNLKISVLTVVGAICRGTMQRVAKRQAVRYMPECYDRDNDDYQEH